MGLAKRSRVVTTGSARPGDYLILTKGAAIEGTAILCTDFAELLKRKGVSEEIIRRGAAFLERVSVVKEALLLSESEVVSAMHDPTEGGILGGVAELAYASRTTAVLDESSIPLAEETITAARALGIDPIRLISSGALIAAVPPGNLEDALELLRGEGIEAAVIGKLEERRGYLVEVRRRSGDVELVRDVYVMDELFKLWERIEKVEN